MSKDDTLERNIQIRDLHAAGWTQTDIAEKFGLAAGHISRICRYRTDLDDAQEASKMQRLTDRAKYDRKRLRVSLRNEDIIRECAEIGAAETTAFKPVKIPTLSKRKEAVEETLVVLLSDGHHDQVVRAEEVNGLENYNFPITLRRGERFVDTILKFAKQTLVGYDFNRLVLLSLGDSTSGEIHDAERRSAFGNQFKNSLAIGAFHAAIIRDLAGHFPQVDVVCTSGNHGRRTTRKEYAGGAHNNWDYMCNRVAQQHLINQPNVSFDIPNSWDTIVDIEGFSFHCSHGDDVAASGGNPWNGLQTLHKTNSGIHRGSDQGQPFCDAKAIDYYCIGHYHTLGSVDGNGVGYLCNGAWLGTDQYAYQSLRVAGRPQQLMFGVHKDHGKTWSLPIHLDGRDNAESCRYDRILDSVDGLNYTLNAPRASGEGWL
jgi:hypothetical protein